METTAPRRSSRVTKPPERLKDYVVTKGWDFAEWLCLPDRAWTFICFVAKLLTLFTCSYYVFPQKGRECSVCGIPVYSHVIESTWNRDCLVEQRACPVVVFAFMTFMHFVWLCLGGNPTNSYCLFRQLEWIVSLQSPAEVVLSLTSMIVDYAASGHFLTNET